MSFIVVPVIPSPHCPLPTPLWLLLNCSEVPRYLKYTKVFKLYERSGGRTGIFWFLVSSFHVACANQLQFTKREGIVERRVFRNYYKGYMDKSKGEGGSWGGREVWQGEV